MHDPFDNPGIAAASQVLRGATGKSGRADDVDQSNFRAPRAVTRRGVRVFAVMAYHPSSACWRFARCRSW